MLRLTTLKISYLFLIFFLVLIKCQGPTSNGNNNSEDQEGIEAVLTFDKSEYSLDDTISVDFLAVNKSKNNKIHIYTTNGPLHLMSVYNTNDELVQFLPQFITQTVYNFYFEPGDTIQNHVSWNQSTFSRNIYNNLKAYSGEYLIKFSYTGVNTSGLDKWITITEEGEPLSSKLYWHFSAKDSIKLDFLIRNRISKKLIYLIKKNEKPMLQFYEYGVATPIRELELKIDFDEIKLLEKSDCELFSYQESKENLKNIGLDGIYNCKIIIPCTSKDIIAEYIIII